MERIGPNFKNDSCQAKFDQFGFVKIPLLTSEEVASLKHVYTQVKQAHDNIGLPFITTSHSNNAELITKVNDRILEIVSPKILNVIADSEILFSNFLVKKPGVNSESNPHQDINIVDESKFLSFSVWIALDDNNPLNGAMRFLAKSHLFDFSIRANSSAYWCYDQLSEAMKRDMLSCSTKAGEAIVFAHSTIHASYPNLSKVDRLACVVSLYPQKASLINYYSKPGDNSQMQLYAMTKDAFVNYVKGEEPHFGSLIKSFDFSYDKVDAEQYRSLKQNVNK